LGAEVEILDLRRSEDLDASETAKVCDIASRTSIDAVAAELERFSINLVRNRMS